MLMHAVTCYGNCLLGNDVAIEVSITGSFGETPLVQSFLEAVCDQVGRCSSNFLGFSSEASRFQFRTNIEDPE
jgi:hypothetical protein